MPYVKKIELRGFKSFGPKTVTVTLNKGFTVITGPNGSGKTNIVDAILFVLGELSARRMRAVNLSKLIFHGSPEAGIAKAKFSKIILQFDNNDRRIPVDTNTVSISREVFSNGQCVYRLNGRRISRGNINNILSIAGITSSGHNIILQGTITRMTDISSVNRRKIIENMVGIAQYDLEKKDAEEKLRVAEISMRTATGRIDEVQKRVDDLERERNQLLRYNHIQKEVKRFEAMKLSHQIKTTKDRLSEIYATLEEAKKKVETLRSIRDEMRNQRHSNEREWRNLSSNMVEEGGSKVLEVQIKIGNLKSRLTELATKISASSTTLEGLKKVRENYNQQLDVMRKEINENRKLTLKLKRKREKFLGEIENKQSDYQKLSENTSTLWQNINNNSKKIREKQKIIDKLYLDLTNQKTSNARKITSKQVLLHRLKDRETQKKRLSDSIEELQKSLEDLEEVQKGQNNRLKSLQELLERRQLQKETVEKEIDEAGRISGTAREAIVEFVTQKEIAETVAAQEHTLRNIEELSELGVISGIFGRLKNLIRIDRKYRKALEAAGAGWLDALVVKDIETAFTCTETLRRMKLGRIKIIPISEIKKKPLTPPKNKRVEGPATAFIKAPREYKPAVDFVYGDTIVTANDKVALDVSLSGLRSVTVNGDVYEVGGGFESGFYRKPVDFSTIIPSEVAIKSLDEAVHALQEHLVQRDREISSFDEEMSQTRINITQLSEAIVTLDTEISRVRKGVKITNRNIRRVNFYIESLKKKIKKENIEIKLQRTQRRETRNKITKLRNDLSELRKKIDPMYIQELEVNRDILADDLVKLRASLGNIKTELSTLQSKYVNVLKLSSENVKVQLRKVIKQIKVMEAELDEASQEREQLKEELVKLEKNRQELSETVLGARKEAKKFTFKIDEIDKKLKKLDTEYEISDRLYNQLQLQVQTSILHLDNFKRQLFELGYEHPIQDILNQLLEEAETSLRMMQFELERLGAVNQLALSQYAEQMSRYKELSLRINELDREKQAIVNFMNEIEQKKCHIFMDAFGKINDNLKRYFMKVTGGGYAELKLENPEDPFMGGVDMIVQFPSKPPILVSGASGGERSVSAVAFLFAIQDYTPAAFYILDEVDAHLDAFHIGKLGELLLEESKKSQFIVVTLKPEMVNKAQRIYGVYERKGVSNVVSATFGEYA